MSKGQDHARVSPMDHGDGNAPAATEGRSMGEEQALELQCQYWEEGSRLCNGLLGKLQAQSRRSNSFQREKKKI